MSLGQVESLAGQKIAGEGAERRKLIDSTGGPLDFMLGTGDPTQSPLYGAFLNKSREAISSSYDNAMYNSRSAAASRGFGYTSPIAQSGEGTVRAQEAGALSAAPRQALMDVIQPELAASQIKTSQASQFDPAKYFSTLNQAEQQRAANKRALYGSIAKLAGAAIGAFVPGAGALFDTAASSSPSGTAYPSEGGDQYGNLEGG